MNDGPVIETTEGSDPLVGRVLAGRYRIERLLGAGGMGAVYLAQHVKLQKPMAVKVLHKQMSTVTEVVGRFEREAIAAARIDHPNVVAANDFGTLEDGSFFLVLEYIAGRDVQQILEAEGPMDTLRALRIALQIADALSAAHEARIVHRDLKPENIMLVDRKARKDIVKVLDFGIAKVTLEDTRGAPQLTRLGAVFGTPQYMAPEQAAGIAVDSRADIYGLGILLFEMLDGRPPFDSPDPVRVVQMQLREAPRPLREGIDPRVSALVFKLLEKKPAERVQSADEVVAHLRELVYALEHPQPVAKSLPAQAPQVQRAPPEAFGSILSRRVSLGALQTTLGVVLAACLAVALGILLLATAIIAAIVVALT